MPYTIITPKAPTIAANSIHPLCTEETSTCGQTAAIEHLFAQKQLRSSLTPKKATANIPGTITSSFPRFPRDLSRYAIKTEIQNAANERANRGVTRNGGIEKSEYTGSLGPHLLSYSRSHSLTQRQSSLNIRPSRIRRVCRVLWQPALMPRNWSPRNFWRL